MDYANEGYPGEPQRTRHGSPTFYNLLSEMAETHDKKSHDYANNNAPFANYEFAGTLASMFSHSPLDAGFVGRMGEKIYRLYVLESGGKVPLNESIADTERDIAVIATLWMAARKDTREKQAIYGGARAPGKTVTYDNEVKEAAAEQSSPAAAPDFKRELESLINRFSMENPSNTPDFILANYLCECLRVWNSNVSRRTNWYGAKESPLTDSSSQRTRGLT